VTDNTDIVPELTDAGAVSFAGKARKTWRFIAATAAVLILGGASLAYVLATYTAAPLIKLPDTITPISALSGQEYWPVLYPDHSHVLYQHKPIDSSKLNWSVQNLTDLRIEHLAQKYRNLSQALWLDAHHIVFRADSSTNSCYFYRQRLRSEEHTSELQSREK